MTPTEFASDVFGIFIMLLVFVTLAYAISHKWDKMAREKAREKRKICDGVYADCIKLHKFKRVGETDIKICGLCGLKDKWLLH